MEQQLLNNMAEILEVDADDLALQTDFRDKRFTWDSLKGYAVLVMLEEEFDTRITVDAFLSAKTIQDLLDFCKK
jgi:acyl carrier protein